MGQRKIGCMLILLLILLFPLNVSATQSRTGNFNKSFTLSGNQANDICSVALAQYQRTGAMFGYTEGWCADFVSDCAILAGASSAIPASGGVSYLKQNILNAGGQVVSTPQVGDIAFMDWGGGGNYYHVEIVYAVSGSTVSTIGGNSGRNTSSNSTSEVWKHGPYAVNHKYFTCFV
ncbi:MAG: CHAP domain-containing protein, partial [Wujia sp.]